MKKLEMNQMELLQGGICIIDEPGSAGCINRCNATFIAYVASGGRYPGPLCLAI